VLKFVIKDDNALLNAIDYLTHLEPDQDDPLEIVVRDYQKLRTKKQNSLYWRWLGILRKESGNSKDVLHAYYKDKFLPSITESYAGEQIRVTKSTRDLTPREFTDYLSEVEEHAREFHNIVLPQPDEELPW